MFCCSVLYLTIVLDKLFLLLGISLGNLNHGSLNYSVTQAKDCPDGISCSRRAVHLHMVCNQAFRRRPKTEEAVLLNVQRNMICVLMAATVLDLHMVQRIPNLLVIVQLGPQTLREYVADVSEHAV